MNEVAFLPMATGLLMLTPKPRQSQRQGVKDNQPWALSDQKLRYLQQ